jgi:hypothetical protein
LPAIFLLAIFEQNCDGSIPALHGQIHWIVPGP